MTLALFDLDNTLLSGDSDYEWGQYLVSKGLVERDHYETANQYFYEQYKQGVLDIHEFSAFSFKPLSERSMAELAALHQEFMASVINPLITETAKQLVEQHRRQGHTLMVITATNSFITRPIVEAFGIPHLLATEPKVVNGRYTREIDGVPCFQAGKVTRLQHWLANRAETLRGSYFYSDSRNDLPLLEMVDNPVAVDPDDTLHQIAIDKGWPVISLR
ncbi:HAD-superfamily subfamily IB hydrolase, TIGR01490 [Thiothrix caldifontis]|uniref:HAD-superfamily subfamily IB hydrolase, TIGR01490 n=1 Tax=Thiothrix caldifontis TaxID=525918 RepID=A0A1H3VV31_9GAMM|nr:HAD family hydrolase [Thiothrix caldifontis]SDZ78693.1 HAD-superfamily subfamily IB hydrolase, TIGR01490 [Thiothrix caldifontis]